MIAGLPLALAAGPAPARWADLAEADRARILRELQGRPLPERILLVSGRFLGTPYVFSPLGEGEGKDPDPPERFDAVDCLTFVEQTLAMATSPGPEAVLEALRQIRYAHQPTYEDRNHLMEAEWLPANAAKGFIRDVTRRYGGEDAVEAQKVITRATWRSASSRALELPPERQITGRFRFSIIPLEKVMAHARRFPSGAVLLVVREDLPQKVTRITHLGFVLQRGRRTFLRHAARNVFARVIDEDLESFLARNARYDKWKVSGVALWEPLSPGDAKVARGAP